MSTSQHEMLISSLKETSHKLLLSNAVLDFCSEAPDEHVEFVVKMLNAELDARESSKKTRLIKRAGFPVLKFLKDYDYKNVQLPRQLDRQEMENCEFIDKKQNLILFGSVGTGKTHLATALGIEACRKGYNVRFYTVPQLVMKLEEAIHKGTTSKLTRELLKQDLLILDEFGYIPVDREGAQLLFKIVAESYETKSLILTTNQDFSKWGSIFTDTQMAAAMLDRLAHHGHLLRFEGRSYRIEHSLMQQ